MRGVSGWMFLLVPAHPGRPGQRAIKRSCVCTVCVWLEYVVDRLTGTCVVNFWYDMAYDIRYCYYKFVESLISARHLLPRSPSAGAAVSATCSCGKSSCICRTDSDYVTSSMDDDS